uniref:Uncharacterized protein n=1 Tax=viral metagenome TaxID=1070528 RepID=A0A6C0EC59_9ZZZZ
MELSDYYMSQYASLKDEQKQGIKRKLEELITDARHDLYEDRHTISEQMTEEIKSSLELFNSMTELERQRNVKWRSRYGDYYHDTFEFLTQDPKNYCDYGPRLHISDWIMFNKFNIKPEIVERLLEQCKISYTDDYTIRLDCWNLTYHSRVIYIEYIAEGFDDMSYVKSHTDKRYAIRNLLSIMDATDKQHINMHNYKVIQKWDSVNSLAIQYTTDLLVDKINKYKQTIPININTVININNRMSNYQFYKILFKSAKYGTDDCNVKFDAIWQRLEDKNNVTEIDGIKIYTPYDKNTVDLKNYLIHNGALRTDECVKRITFDCEYIYNCEHVSVREFFVALHRALFTKYDACCSANPEYKDEIDKIITRGYVENFCGCYPLKFRIDTYPYFDFRTLSHTYRDIDVIFSRLDKITKKN